VKPAGTIALSVKLTIGRVAIAAWPFATNEAIAHFATDDDAIRLYTYEYLKHFDYESLGSTSSIGEAINSRIVKALPFVMPCRSDLEDLHEILNPMFENMRLCQTRIELAREARDRLLPKLMSGEIEVEG
jgi:type I restriction enzyme S subunit